MLGLYFRVYFQIIIAVKPIKQLFTMISYFLVFLCKQNKKRYNNIMCESKLQLSESKRSNMLLFSFSLFCRNAKMCETYLEAKKDYRTMYMAIVVVLLLSTLKKVICSGTIATLRICPNRYFRIHTP